MSEEVVGELWVAVAFVIFLAVLAKLGVHRMILGVLDARGARIKAELDEAKRVREEAQALLAEYQRKRADADREADAILVAAREEAERVAAEAKAKVEEFVVRRTKVAETKIAQAEAQAVADVRTAAAEAAVGAAERILAETTKGKVGENLVTQGIRDLKAKLN
jgi:F-type H+-transporting ATPase subunit b